MDLEEATFEECLGVCFFWKRTSGQSKLIESEIPTGSFEGKNVIARRSGSDCAITVSWGLRPGAREGESEIEPDIWSGFSQEFSPAQGGPCKFATTCSG